MVKQKSIKNATRARHALLLLVFVAASAFAGQGTPSYVIEDVPEPAGTTLEVGGLCFATDGTLLVCTRWGEVWARRGKDWKLFASGLHEPLGIWAERSDDVYVMQRPELTRLRDTNADGSADRFETVCADWFIKGLETEYTYGLARDSDGNFWSALGPNWDNEPRSKYRCWSFKITPQGRLERWSCGLRNADGICVTPQNEVLLIDNQGEWTGACGLHHATKDAFHGCPWGTHSADWLKGVPQTAEALDKHRKRPAVIFPFEQLARSPTQPLVDATQGKFGPFAGQIFVGDHTTPMLARVALEKVGGELQGACFPFFKWGVKRGTHRLAFAPDGSLYLGQTVRGWLGQGNEGLQRISFTGKPPFEIQSMTLTATGFELAFTLPVNAAAAAQPDQYRMRRFRYEYSSAYGSPEVDNEAVTVKAAQVSADGKRVTLEIADLKPERIYEVSLAGLTAADGTPLYNPTAWYTLNRLKK